MYPYRYKWSPVTYELPSSSFPYPFQPTLKNPHGGRSEIGHNNLVSEQSTLGDSSFPEDIRQVLSDLQQRSTLQSAEITNIHNTLHTLESSLQTVIRQLAAIQSPTPPLQSGGPFAQPSSANTIGGFPSNPSPAQQPSEIRQLPITEKPSARPVSDGGATSNPTTYSALADPQHLFVVQQKILQNLPILHDVRRRPQAKLEIRKGNGHTRQALLTAYTNRQPPKPRDFNFAVEIVTLVEAEIMVARHTFRYSHPVPHFLPVERATELTTQREVSAWPATPPRFIPLSEIMVILQCHQQRALARCPVKFFFDEFGLGSISLGNWSHLYVMRQCEKGVAGDVLMNNSLIDMYGPGGFVRFAWHLFDEMPEQNVTSWNSMIFGFAMHGYVPEALNTFSQMCITGQVKPYSISFVGVLTACRLRGLVGVGRRYFDLTVSEYKIVPQIEHYGCVVNLLVCAGSVEEAIDVVSAMPIRPDVVIWRSFLSAYCKRKAGVEISKLLAQQILELDGGFSRGIYVILSRVYASANQWNDVGILRRLLFEKGVLKEPGCRSIVMAGIVHEFLAGDSSPPRTKELFDMLSLYPSDSVPNPEIDLLEPAVTGTLNVLTTSTEANMTQVIVISSAFAVAMTPTWPQDTIMDETCWSAKVYCRSTGNWHYLATPAPKSDALEYGPQNKLDVVSVCPTLILGLCCTQP